MSAFGQTVVLVTRTRSGEDAYGNDIFTPTAKTLRGVAVWPRSSVENVQGRDTVVTGLTALLPADTDASAIDKVTVYGSDYEVDGDPNVYDSPLTGSNPGVVVNLRRVAG